MSGQKDFPTLIDKDPKAFERLIQGQEDVFEEQSETEKVNFNNWIKEMKLDKDVEGIRAIDTTQIQDDLNELD